MQNGQKFKRLSTGRKIATVCSTILFGIFAMVFLYTIDWVILNALKEAQQFNENSSFELPEAWKFTNFIKVFTEFHYRDYYYLDMLFNSLWMFVVRILVNVMSSALLAYAIAKFRFPGKEFLYGLVIFANTIPIVGSGAATYKLFLSLNMVNNPFLIWMACAGGFDLAFIVLYGTFRGISSSYSEAAKIDGANNLTVLFRVVFPQAFPSIVAVAITQAVGVWNDYNTVMLYMRDFPNLAYGLYLYQTEEPDLPVYFAAICISILPVLIIYAANQNLVLQNVTTGGLKG